MLILGIETSCDDTSIALLECGGKSPVIRAMHTFSQVDIHAVFGGVVPEVASRNHMIKIAPLLDKVLNTSNAKLSDIDLIAVTSAPGLIGALFVGVSFAKGLSYGLNIPLVPVHHLSGHILSAELSHPELGTPYIALVISGGHSHIYNVEGTPPRFTLLGRTIDDAAGEAFDKVAKMLSGPYPGGPFIEKLAGKGVELAIKFPVALKNTDNFSFSGLKTSVLTRVKEGIYNHSDIAASFQYTVAKTLADKVFRLADENGQKNIVVAGGVACNGRIRQLFTEYTTEKNKNVFFPEIALCNDNAAMIAYSAWKLTQGKDLSTFTRLDFAAGDTQHEISTI